MDISFHTLVYTDIASVAEWNERHNIKPKPLAQKKVNISAKNTNSREYFIGKMVLLAMYLCIAGILGFFFPQTLVIFMIIGVILFTLLFSADSIWDYKPPSIAYHSQAELIGKRFLFVGEKIHFSETGITMSNFHTKKEYSFLYAEMSEIVLEYVGMKAEWDIKASKLSWKHQEKQYEYHIQIDSQYRIKQLITVIQFLYDKNIGFQEVNEDGKKLHFLHLIEAPKPEKKKAIDPEILSLIAEIGEKEE